MMPRTYQLADVGLELFLQPAGRASLYLTFESPAARDAAAAALAAQPALRLAARRRCARACRLELGLAPMCIVACAAAQHAPAFASWRRGSWDAGALQEVGCLK